MIPKSTWGFPQAYIEYSPTLNCMMPALLHIAMHTTIKLSLDYWYNIYLLNKQRNNMTSRLRVILLALIAISMASFVLCHFACIWIYGEFYIYESNTYILTLETMMIVASLGFSTYCIIREIQRIRQ